VWADPSLPDRWEFNAPIVHIQRGQDFGDEHLTLDSALLDVDIYAMVADHARALGEQIRTLIRLTLPLHTFDNGLFVKSTGTVMAPCWQPFRDPGGSNRSAITANIARRGATYRVLLHGMIG
jgi:hypothetical protein